MLNRVITISREFGSGGRTIGRKVAEKFGIPCYDAELIQKIAEESGYTADYIAIPFASTLSNTSHISSGLPPSSSYKTSRNLSSRVIDAIIFNRGNQ